MKAETTHPAIARLKAVLRQIFPRPRRAIGFVDCIPLILFLLLFAGACLYLELSDRLMFLRPWAFCLMVVAPWVWWMSTAGFAGLGTFRNQPRWEPGR